MVVRRHYNRESNHRQNLKLVEKVEAARSRYERQISRDKTSRIEDLFTVKPGHDGILQKRIATFVGKQEDLSPDQLAKLLKIFPKRVLAMMINGFYDWPVFEDCLRVMLKAILDDSILGITEPRFYSKFDLSTYGNDDNQETVLVLRAEKLHVLREIERCGVKIDKWLNASLIPAKTVVNEGKNYNISFVDHNDLENILILGSKVGTCAPFSRDRGVFSFVTGFHAGTKYAVIKDDEGEIIGYRRFLLAKDENNKAKLVLDNMPQVHGRGFIVDNIKNEIREYIQNFASNLANYDVELLSSYKDKLSDHKVIGGIANGYLMHNRELYKNSVGMELPEDLEQLQDLFEWAECLQDTTVK